MQTGYSTNKAGELAMTLARKLPELSNADASEIVSRIIALLDAAIPMQNHSGGLSDR